MTDVKRAIVADSLAYYDWLINRRWCQLEEVTTESARFIVLESIGDLRAERRQFEIANSDAEVA